VITDDDDDDEFTQRERGWEFGITHAAPQEEV
jgi:hypothetical protein